MNPPNIFDWLNRDLPKKIFRLKPWCPKDLQKWIRPLHFVEELTSCQRWFSWGVGGSLYFLPPEEHCNSSLMNVAKKCSKQSQKAERKKNYKKRRATNKKKKFHCTDPAPLMNSARRNWHHPRLEVPLINNVQTHRHVSLHWSYLYLMWCEQFLLCKLWKNWLGWGNTTPWEFRTNIINFVTINQCVSMTLTKYVKGRRKIATLYWFEILHREEKAEPNLWFEEIPEFVCFIVWCKILPHDPKTQMNECPKWRAIWGIRMSSLFSVSAHTD